MPGPAAAAKPAQDLCPAYSLACDFPRRTRDHGWSPHAVRPDPRHRKGSSGLQLPQCVDHGQVSLARGPHAGRVRRQLLADAGERDAHPLSPLTRIAPLIRCERQQRAKHDEDGVAADPGGSQEVRPPPTIHRCRLGRRRRIRRVVVGPFISRRAPRRACGRCAHQDCPDGRQARNPRPLGTPSGWPVWSRFQAMRRRAKAHPTGTPTATEVGT